MDVLDLQPQDRNTSALTSKLHFINQKNQKREEQKNMVLDTNTYICRVKQHYASSFSPNCKLTPFLQPAIWLHQYSLSNWWNLNLPYEVKYTTYITLKQWTVQNFKSIASSILPVLRCMKTSFEDDTRWFIPDQHKGSHFDIKSLK